VRVSSPIPAQPAGVVSSYARCVCFPASLLPLTCMWRASRRGTTSLCRPLPGPCLLVTRSACAVSYEMSGDASVTWAHLGLAPSAAEVVALRCPAPRVLAVSAHALVAFLPAEAADGVTLRACCMRSGTCLWERVCAPAAAGALLSLRLSQDGRSLVATCAAGVFTVSALDGAPLKSVPTPAEVASSAPAPLGAGHTVPVLGGVCRWQRSLTGQKLTLSCADARLDVPLLCSYGVCTVAASPCGAVLLVAAAFPRGCVLRRFRLRVSPCFSRVGFLDLPLPIRLALREAVLCLRASLLRHVDASTFAGITDAICVALMAVVAAEQGEALQSLSLEALRQEQEAQHPGGLLLRRLARQLDVEPVPRARDCPRGMVLFHHAQEDQQKLVARALFKFMRRHRPAAAARRRTRAPRCALWRQRSP